MGEGVIIKEHEDGSATMELELTEEEREVLVGEGVMFILLKSMFDFKSDNEMIDFISQHREIHKDVGEGDGVED